MKNYGVNLKKEKEEVDEKDWEYKIGGNKICLSEKLKKSLMKYLAKGELQYGVEDFMDCATRSPINEAEAKFTGLIKEEIISSGNIKWLKEKRYWNEAHQCVEFSDRFIAILSGTTRQGNSLKSPVDTIYRYSLIPKSMLPRKGNMNWVMYHNKKDITEEMYQLAEEFKRRFTINYERVKDSEFIKIDCGVAGHAWGLHDENGIYQRVEGSINHAFFKPKDKPIIQIVDNYLDPHDRDFIKQLAPNYKLMHYGYRLIISENIIDPEINNKGMINLIKFETDTATYLQSINYPKELYWIGDENTFKIFKRNGWSGDWGDIIELSDSLRPNYKIMGGMIKASYVNKIINALFGR